MPDNCKHWQELLAEHALTTGPHRRTTDTGMNDDLAAHIAGCVECQAVASEFRSLAEALNSIEAINARPVATPAPVGLTDRINARIDEQRRHHRRARRYAAVAGAAATLLIVVSLIAWQPLETNDTRENQLALNAGAIQADTTLEPRAWGTQIRVAGSGFTPGQPYNVWLEQADGTHVAAGTFTGVRNARITVLLASALPTVEAAAIGISKPDGTLIVRAPLD